MVFKKEETENLKCLLQHCSGEKALIMLHIFCPFEVNALLNKRCYPSLIMLIVEGTNIGL